MFSLKEKFKDLKDDAKIIENNINKVKIMLDNERKNILDLQDEIQNDYDLIAKKIKLFEEEEKELNSLKEELKDTKQNMIESNIENNILKEKIENLTKDNKELKEKLYQKEKDELKFKMLTNENTANIKNLAGKIDKQNNEINQYKVEIANLKANIEKQNTPKKIEKDIEKVISSKPIKNTYLNNINSSKNKIPIEPKTKHLKLEKEKEKEKKIYIDLLKEINLDTNNIEKFILDRSKLLEDPEELSTNDWKKILSFGVTHKILTNREIQQLKQISLMLGNFGYKNERSKLFNKVKENGFEISLYKIEDWEKVLDFLEEKKAITKEVKEGFVGIFKKYKKKKMFKLEQLRFILPYFEKYKEDIEKNKEIANIITVNEKNEKPKIHIDEDIIKLINNKLNSFTDVKTLNPTEWKKILNFGIQYKLFNHTDIKNLEEIIVYLKYNSRLYSDILERAKIKLELAKTNGFEISLFDYDEWNKIINYLKDHKILTSNIIKEFYNISNESEETGFFSLEQLKFILPYFERFKGLENEDIIYKPIEEFKESKYDLSEKENRTLRELKLFSSEDWKNLTMWSKKRSLIENEDIEIIDYLIYGTSTQKFEEFEEFELITLIELYDHLKKEGFNVKDFNLEKEKYYDTLLEELELFDPEDWRELYEWSDKKLLIQHEDHKLLDPLVNGGFIEETSGSDLINLLDLYDRLVGKGFKKNLNISKENTSEIFKKNSQQDDDKLLEEVKKFKSKDWIEILDWSKKNKKLKTRDHNFLSNLAFKSINNKLNDTELILGLEIYFIAKSEGFKRVKDEDIDNFLMQFMDDAEDKEEDDEINLDFEYLVDKGLENGFIEYTMLEKIDYNKEIEISDHFEAIEVLEDRGIAIKY